MEECLNGLKIEKLVGGREKQQILVIKLILENHTQQKRKTRAQQTQPQVRDLVFIRDFERDKYYGQKLDVRQISLKIFTKITLSRVSGFV